MKGVWGTSFDGGTNVVDVYVKRLRWKLTSEKIETVRNVGYRLVAHGCKAWFSAAWLVFAVVNATLVFVMVGEETIPYHLIWASFALMYGFWPWPRKMDLDGIRADHPGDRHSARHARERWGDRF